MRWIKICIFFLLPLTAIAEGNLMFEKANELYHNKNYDSASALYTKLLDNSFCSADLYYNAGNAYYRTGKIGLSIWAYKRSMAIELNRDVEENYLIAKKMIDNPLILHEPVFFIKWWKGLYKFFTVNVWSIIALSCFLLWLGMLFFERIQRRGFPLWFKRSVLGVSIICLILMFVRYYNDVNRYEAIVIKESAFRETLNAKSMEAISEGVEVSLLANAEGDANKKKASWVKVQLPDGRSGWLLLTDIKKI